MEIKVYTIKLDPPRWLRNLILYVGLPLSALIGGALAVRAAVTLTTFSAGEPIRAKDVNANFAALNAALEDLQQKVHPASAFHAWVTITKTVTIPMMVTTQVVFDEEEFDLGDEYTPASGVFKAKQAGHYLFTCQLEFASTTIADWGVQILKNGTEVGASTLQTALSATLGSETVIVEVDAEDTVTCAAYQGTSGGKSLYRDDERRNSFSGARLY